MVTRNISLVPNEYYHIYNRGTEKRTIFKDHNDYNRFLELLFLSNSNQAVNFRDIKKSQELVYDYDRGESLVDIGAYCLMPNHFHILVRNKDENGISQFMNKLGTSYSMYFNKRYDRTGSLFQGPYRAEWANSDRYFKYLFSYIHLNPVKLIAPNWKDEGIKDAEAILNYLNGYKFSSYLDFALGLPWGKGGRTESRILNIEEFPEYFSTTSSFRREIFEWLKYADFP